MSATHFPPTLITYEADPLLVVTINYHRAETPVTYEYDGEHGSTPFQAADMPRDEQRAARKVSDWLDSQS